MKRSLKSNASVCSATDQMLISVVVPTLNAGASIGRTIESILGQSHKNIQLIVIDGGSTDDTLSVLSRYRDRIDYLESGFDTGIANAFNRGVRVSKGEIVAILNADDYWLPDTLLIVARQRVDHPDAGVFFGSVVFFNEATGLRYQIDPRLDRLSVRMYLFHPAVFVAKHAYDSIGLFDESYELAMDSEWIHRAVSHKILFRRVDRVLAFMSLGGASDMNYVRALAEYRKSVISHGLASRFMATIYFCWILVAKGLLRLGPARRFTRTFRRRKSISVE